MISSHANYRNEAIEKICARGRGFIHTERVVRYFLWHGIGVERDVLLWNCYVRKGDWHRWGVDVFNLKARSSEADCWWFFGMWKMGMGDDVYFDVLYCMGIETLGVEHYWHICLIDITSSISRYTVWTISGWKYDFFFFMKVRFPKSIHRTYASMRFGIPNIWDRLF